MIYKQKIKQIRYLSEALIVRFGVFIFALLGLKKSTNLTSFLAKLIGKKHPVHKLAYKNLSNAMPNLSHQEKEEVLDKMWDNLGRVIAEYAYLINQPIEKIDDFFVIDEESKKNIELIKLSNKGGMLFSGHLGNWELGPKFFLKHGIENKAIYRPMNNPYVEKMIIRDSKIGLIPKGASGTRQIIEAIKNKQFVMILADQKNSEGEMIDFFHQKAATTTSIARIALKYDVLIVPVRSIRIGKESKFIARIEKPLEFERTNDPNNDIINFTRQINLKLESWIKEDPSQWFWVHDRWKK
jgi:KDO2-lipid IV(A) lauroyltransferase